MMKSFIKATVTAICAMLIIYFTFVIVVLGYRNINALIHGIINISLVLEFVGAVIIFGIIIGVFSVLENDKKNNYCTCQKPGQPADPFTIKRITDTEFESGVEDLVEKKYMIKEMILMNDTNTTLIGIENELHNMNLNIIELIKTIKEVSAPKVEKPDIPYDPSIDPFAM